MNNYERTSHDGGVAELKKEIDFIATNYLWLEDRHVKFLEPVLKRRLNLLSKAPNKPEKYGALAGKFHCLLHGYPENYLISPLYTETWTIYNSGGHYQPLIKK